MSMTTGEIFQLVNNYIGVDGGYLGDFSYRSHEEFYLSLDLDIDPYQYNGTTRERFIHILRNALPDVQARIVRGILDRYPAESSPLRTQERFQQFTEIAARIEGTLGVSSPSPQVSSQVVNRAIADAESLLQSSGATSSVDRIHTALHGYLRAVCNDSGLPYNEQATMNQLYRVVREQHPAFANFGPRSDDIDTLLRTFTNVLNVLNPLRNRASVAHPNPDLLNQPEAMLVINVARTLLHYFDARLASHHSAESSA